MLRLARVAAPTAEAERNVSSSPVSEAAFGGTPSGWRFCVPGIAPGHGSSPTTPEPAPRRAHNGEVSRVSGSRIVMPYSLAILPPKPNPHKTTPDPCRLER
jgi:hypothetical protein